MRLNTGAEIWPPWWSPTPNRTSPTWPTRRAGTPEPFLKDQFNDLLPSFSPDGRWLAYSSNESGPSEVYVRPFPPLASGQGGKWVISNQGGQHPVWSRTKNDLPYMAADGQIMAASYTVNGDTFVADKARVWLAKPGGTQFDLSSDGKRLVWASNRNGRTACRRGN